MRKWGQFVKLRMRCEVRGDEDADNSGSLGRVNTRQLKGTDEAKMSEREAAQTAWICALTPPDRATWLRGART